MTAEPACLPSISGLPRGIPHNGAPLSLAFAQPTLWKAGFSVFEVVAEDFNHDGHADLVVVNAGDDTISCLLGSGTGEFAAARTFSSSSSKNRLLSSGSRALRAGDLNGDGHLDVVVSNEYTNDLAFLAGRGDGTFASATFTPAGVRPWEFTIADLDADGKLDIAVSVDIGHTIGILLGNGDGSFRARTDYPLPRLQGTFDVAATDLDGDGVVDLIVPFEWPALIAVMPGIGNGRFGPARTFPCDGDRPYHVLIVDLNRDGKCDVAFSSISPSFGQVSALLGHGDGTLGRETNVRPVSGAPSIVAADFDLDGIIDLALGSEGDHVVAVLRGVGDGTFRAPNAFSTSRLDPMRLAVADVNEDGKPDIVFAGLSNVGVLINESM